MCVLGVGLSYVTGRLERVCQWWCGAANRVHLMAPLPCPGDIVEGCTSLPWRHKKATTCFVCCWRYCFEQGTVGKSPDADLLSCCVSTATPLKRNHSTACQPTRNCSKRHWWFALELRYLLRQLHEQNDCIRICSPSSLTSIHDCDGRNAVDNQTL
jgi:hypothetical protein